MSLKLFTAIERRQIMDGNATCSLKFHKSETYASYCFRECGYCVPHLLLVSCELGPGYPQPGSELRDVLLLCLPLWAEEVGVQEPTSLTLGPEVLVSRWTVLMLGCVLMSSPSRPPGSSLFIWAGIGVSSRVRPVDDHIKTCSGHSGSHLKMLPV